jgi:hypothetical protein
MARRQRNREADIALGVAQLIALILLLGVISPQGGQILSSVGYLAVCILGMVVVGVIGFGAYRFATRSQRGETIVERNVDWQALGVDVKVERTPPQTTTNFIEQLRAIDWFQFEKLVALAYRKLGYSVTQRGGANPDGGIDLVIEKDYQRSAVQCKQWRTRKIRENAVRELIGAMTHEKIQHGIFITLRGSTANAKQLAEQHRIEIINAAQLAQMLDSTDAKFDPEVQAILHDAQKFCPKCESKMVIVTARRWPHAGRKFWGCSTFPNCKGRLPVA